MRPPWIRRRVDPRRRDSTRPPGSAAMWITRPCAPRSSSPTREREMREVLRGERGWEREGERDTGHGGALLARSGHGPRPAWWRARRRGGGARDLARCCAAERPSLVPTTGTARVGAASAVPEVATAVSSTVESAAAESTRVGAGSAVSELVAAGSARIGTGSAMPSWNCRGIGPDTGERLSSTRAAASPPRGQESGELRPGLRHRCGSMPLRGWGLSQP